VVLNRLVVVPPEFPLATPALPPVQKPLILLGLAITNPPVRLSVKVTPVRVTVVLGLLTSKVMVLLPPGRTELGANCFVATGCATAPITPIRAVITRHEKRVIDSSEFEFGTKRVHDGRFS
jgi:hypothetical protein